LSCLNIEPCLLKKDDDMNTSSSTEVFDTKQRSTTDNINNCLKFLDLCAGLGGFHHAFSLVQKELRARDCSSTEYTFKCVMACEIDPVLRQLYVQNFPEIKHIYNLYHTKEWAKEAGFDLYDAEGNLKQIHGDIGKLVDLENQKLLKWPFAQTRSADTIIPKHDILCAGFPCQPFSKSGAQQGFEDVRGTVFGMLAVIIKEHRPPIVLLENVGNFERHDGGNTWVRVRNILETFGYTVRATTHVKSGNGSQGLLSPHHIGLPHHRERFFIAAFHNEKAEKIGITPRKTPFPSHYRSSLNKKEALKKTQETSRRRLLSILENGECCASNTDFEAARLPTSRTDCIEIWNEFLKSIDEHDRIELFEEEKIVPLPSFPIWGYELDPWRWYPIESNPLLITDDRLALKEAWLKRIELAFPLLSPPNELYLQSTNPSEADLQMWVDSWPAYAKRDKWPTWKQNFIRQNRAWALTLISKLDNEWLRSWFDRLRNFSPSLQKLEWNCKGEELNMYKHILQFRPSGLRVKRLCHVPALVAMTTTQTPIVPIQTKKAKKKLHETRARYLMPQEALALQGFPTDWKTPRNKGNAYKAFGNAVHVELVKEIVLHWLF
jgi:DNA (cytosine-5)-methyltransferase 1